MDETQTDTALSAIFQPVARGLQLRVVHSPDLAWLDAMIPDAANVCIGREPSQARAQPVAVDDGHLSRTHAAFQRKPNGSIRLRDAGSRNGLRVNGLSETDVLLSEGDAIRLGRTLVLVAQPPTAGAGRAFGMVGTSARLAALCSVIDRAATSELTVLVCGETGTGKELVAGALHKRSNRPGPLITINCAAIPESLVESTLFGHVRGAFTGAREANRGVFQQAHLGTLFLDEVGELPLAAQAKLLRAIENGEVTPVGGSKVASVSTRVVAATNRDLRAEVEAGAFRADLFARLNGILIDVPPLRERRDDILPLFQAFATTPLPHLTVGFVETLLNWNWPHNVRELKQFAGRLSALHGRAESWDRDLCEPPMLVPRVRHQLVVPTPAIPRPKTREELVELLTRAGGVVQVAANMTGRDRRQVYRWMSRFNVSTDSISKS